MDTNRISAFAFRTGKLIEQLVVDETNNLRKKNQELEAKILDWWAKTDDAEFAEHFGITHHE